MDRDEFLKFRMSLLPASGFQSAQYREIEIYSTDFVNLVARDARSSFDVESSIEEMYQQIYWKYGATDLDSGNKTLTLTQFEEKYDKDLIALGEYCKSRNLWQVYLKLSPSEQSDAEVKKVLRMNDLNVNVYWPLAHYKSAVRYLARKDVDVAATGGTNWQQYLPPKFQKRIFYSGLWNEVEIDQWGKGWVEDQIKEILKGV